MVKITKINLWSVSPVRQLKFQWSRTNTAAKTIWESGVFLRSCLKLGEETEVSTQKYMRIRKTTFKVTAEDTHA